MGIIDNLSTLLDKGQDNALLRYSLGNEYFKAGDRDAAIGHLAQAVALDADYSAAWKLYGKVLTAAGRTTDAATAFEQGIAVAERKGDIQAAKEMGVFLKRLRRALE